MKKLVFFDESVIGTSPAGSCVLRILEGLEGGYAADVVCNRWEPNAVPGFKKVTVPLPRGPVLARSVLFTILSCCAFAVKGPRQALKISTQGVFPFCDVSYAHCCHRLFLSRYRSQIGGGLLRRTFRVLNQAWGELTEWIAFHSATTIVVPSKGLERELETVYGRLVEGKIRVLANPVDTERFRRPESFSVAAARSGLGLSSDAVLFSFCALGNFEWKGLRLILEALSSLRGDRANLVVIGGTKTEVTEYAALTGALGIEARVRFVGMQADIRPFLWSSDAFVLPSTHETFPLVCLQAAAAGLPLITTALYGVEEFAEDGATGWLIRREATSIADAMRSALEDRPELMRMGENARLRVLRYGIERFQACWRELIEELVDETRVNESSFGAERFEGRDQTCSEGRNQGSNQRGQTQGGNGN